MAAAAGIVRYEEGDYPRAISLLNRSRAEVQQPQLQSQGLIDFYLANAYNLNGELRAAAAAYDDAIEWLEEQHRAANLDVQDQLVLVNAYLERGLLDSNAGQWSRAISQYKLAAGHSAALHDGKNALLQPEEVYGTYARLYGLLAFAYLGRGDTRAGDEHAADLARRSGQEEIAFLTQAAESTSSVSLRMDLARAHYALGDCREAVRLLDEINATHPNHAASILEAATVERANGRSDLALRRLQRATEGVASDSVRAWRQRSDLGYSLAINFEYFLNEDARYQQEEQPGATSSRSTWMTPHSRSHASWSWMKRIPMRTGPWPKLRGGAQEPPAAI